MNAQKLISTRFTFLLAMFMLFFTLGANAQSKKAATMKDCCMMKDGKMMVMKDGKSMPMEKDMVCKNGTTCTMSGDCMMKDGTKMKMKEGDCMDMNGKMCTEKMGKMSQKKSTKKSMAAAYACPMHPEVMGDKPGKCSKCGMDLVKK